MSVSRLLPFILALVVAGCDDAPPKAPPPATPSPVVHAPTGPAAPAGGVVTARLPAPELDGVGLTAGTWRFETTPTGIAAIFATDGNVRFTLGCDTATRHIVFTLPGHDAGVLRIVTDTGASTYPTSVANGAVRATTSANDRFVQSVLTDATSRIGIGMNTDPVLLIAPDPVIGRIARTCAQPR